jgi:large subunit ribosomal protein L13
MSGEIIINAENAVLGRLASFVAKKALLGKEIRIVNSEKAIVMGREENIVERYKKKRVVGGSGLKGPLYPSTPERILKRTIRNMLPYKQARGRQALKRVRCYIGIPEEFKDKKMIKSKRGKSGVSLDKISKMLSGGK